MNDHLKQLGYRLLAVWKWVLSFTKSEWSFEDYPVVIRRHMRNADKAPSRLEPVAVSAFVVNWWALCGSGDTPELAISDLKENFSRQIEARRSEGKIIPRPGSYVPLEFASTESVDLYGELAEDFIQRVLELDWAFISDESSLWDFHGEETNDHFISKIKEVYGVDVSDVESANLYEILEAITARRDRVR